MTKMNFDIMIEGKTNYVRERYAKQLVNVYRKHGFRDIQVINLPKAIRVVVKE